MSTRLFRIAALILVAATLTAPRAFAAATLHVGKAIQNSFNFALLDVGVDEGIFKKNGLDITSTAFAGAAKLQQALIAKDIDIGLSTGPDMGFAAKGAPFHAVAVIAGAPNDTVMLVRDDGSIKTVADIKGKKVAVSNIRGYPAWLVIELAKHEGWGPKGLDIVATGSQMASFALLRDKQVDAWPADIGSALEAEQTHQGRILLSFGGVVPDFINTAIYARDDLIENRPDVVRAFVKSWFETVAFARQNKAKTVTIIGKVMHLPPAVMAKSYDIQMPMFSTDGKFQPAALATMRRAIVELGILKEPPDMAKLYTTEFLPRS